MVLFDGKKCLSGSEADFSSSSSTGSLRTRESLTSKSPGKKASSRSRSTHIRSLPVFKPAGSPTSNHDADLYAPYRTLPRVASSTTNSSSCNSSPTSRRANLGHYPYCGDNHGIIPPNPEQYLTPLQRKEVSIRHLKTKLLESENRMHDRETEIEELKGQLCRMREDWIEEECHRVEAQLSLKEARKEIKQLRQVVETMKNSLMEKDKGIQKYFIDINIQNRKLESLLQSMELAQSDVSLQDDNTLDFIFENPESSRKNLVGEEGVMDLGDQAAEAMADSGLLINDEMANRADILEQVFMSTVVDYSQDSKPGMESNPGLSTSSEKSAIQETSCILLLSQQKTEERGIQTDMMPMTQDIQSLLHQLLKVQGGSSLSGSQNEPETATQPPVLMPPTPNPAPLADVGSCGSGPAKSTGFMDELDFDTSADKRPLVVVGKQYWSNSFLVDLVAVAAPVLPTVAWLYSRHGVDGSAPVYNIAALIRGCCIMGLRSLRHTTHKPDM